MNKDTVNQILNRDYIMENVYIRMLHQSQHHSAKYPILNLDAELRIHVRISDSVIGTLQVNDLLCNIANISSDDLWKADIHNFLKDVCIQSITDFLGFSLPNNEYNLYVVRTPKFMNGAAALCIPEVFQNFCKHHHEQSCFILPSSTEDLIVLPYSVKVHLNLDNLAKLVNEINCEVVNPHLRLDPVSYYYDLSTNSICISETLDNRYI